MDAPLHIQGPRSDVSFCFGTAMETQYRYSLDGTSTVRTQCQYKASTEQVQCQCIGSVPPARYQFRTSSILGQHLSRAGAIPRRYSYGPNTELGQHKHSTTTVPLSAQCSRSASTVPAQCSAQHVCSTAPVDVQCSISTTHRPAALGNTK